MLITFSGLDGAGKSTLIEWLAASLVRQNCRVAVVHMNRGVGVYAMLRHIRNRIGGPHGPSVAAPTTSQGARGVRDAIIWSKGLRRFLYVVDLLVFFGYRVYVERLARRVLIMDRYFYDTLVDVADGRHWWLLKLLNRLTPVPTLPIFLDVGPAECYARKGEYSVEYLQRRWDAYGTVLRWVPSSVRLPARDIDAAKASLHELVTARLLSGVGAR